MVRTMVILAIKQCIVVLHWYIRNFIEFPERDEKQSISTHERKVKDIQKYII